MHSLFAASSFSFVSEKMPRYMKRCLLWTGTEMGPGQEALLVEVRAHILDKHLSGADIRDRHMTWIKSTRKEGDNMDRFPRLGQISDECVKERR